MDALPNQPRSGVTAKTKIPPRRFRLTARDDVFPARSGSSRQLRCGYFAAATERNVAWVHKGRIPHTYTFICVCVCVYSTHIYIYTRIYAYAHTLTYTKRRIKKNSIDRPRRLLPGWPSTSASFVFHDDPCFPWQTLTCVSAAPPLSFCPLLCLFIRPSFFQVCFILVVFVLNLFETVLCLLLSPSYTQTHTCVRVCVYVCLRYLCVWAKERGEGQR